VKESSDLYKDGESALLFINAASDCGVLILDYRQK
jgi:hypothetical protein